MKGQRGVYALYRGNQLRYVGLASNLRSRLAQHLRDRHAGTWDHFSIYLTVTDEHLRELESLVLRIASPKGNKLIGQFFNSEDLRPRFRRQIAAFHKLELARMLGVIRPKERVEIAERIKSNGRIPTLAKYVARPFTIRMSHKGRLYKAQVDATARSIIVARATRHHRPLPARSLGGQLMVGIPGSTYASLVAGFHWISCDDRTSV